MSLASQYPVTAFSETQTFLVWNPSTQTLNRVQGSDLVSYITPGLGRVYGESTRAAALNGDYSIGNFIQTAGGSAIGDGGNGMYLVVEGGAGDYAMMNGNDLLLLPFGSLAGSDLDGALVTDDGEQVAIEDAVEKRAVRFASLEDFRASSCSYPEVIVEAANAGATTGRMILKATGTAGGTPTATGDRFTALSAGEIINAGGYGYELSTDQTITPEMFGVTWSGSDEYTALNLFFTYVGDFKCVAAMNGSASTATAITFTGGADSAIDFGQTTITALNAMDWVIKFATHSGVAFKGKLTVIGHGASNNYADRTCADGIVFEGCRGSKFEMLRAEKFLRHGMHVTNVGNNTLLDLGDARSHYCGSSVTANHELTASYSSKANTGSENSTGQRSTFVLSSVPDHVAVNQLCSVAGEPYLITAIAGTTITVFPWIRSTDTTGTVTFYVGSGLQIDGDDAASVKFDAFDATYCSVGVRSASLYGFCGSRLLTQFCGVGLGVGNNSTSGYFGNTLESFYTEGNTFDVIKTNTGNVGLTLDGLYEYYPEKMFALGPRDAAYEYSGLHSGLRSTVLSHNGNVYSKAPHSYGLGYYVTSYTVTADNGLHRIKGGNTLEIALTLDADHDRLFGHTGCTIICYGRNANNHATSITFTATDGGHTVEGGASKVFSSVTAPMLIDVWFDYENDNWSVTGVALT